MVTLLLQSRDGIIFGIKTLGIITVDINFKVTLGGRGFIATLPLFKLYGGLSSDDDSY